MNCPQCRRPCRVIHQILVLDNASLNAWRVQCCATCRRKYQRHNARVRRKHAENSKQAKR